MVCQEVKVVVRKSCLVPADQSGEAVPSRELLSAFSHFAWSTQYRTRFLFFDRPDDHGIGSSMEEIAARLKQGLGKALVEFYPVAGRIVVRKDDLMELDCCNQGVMFIEASADVPLQRLKVGDGGVFEAPTGLLTDLAQTGGHQLKWPWPSDAPLFFIQITQFSCGGICISVKFSHQVLDGTSAWHFVKSWAETSCGKTMSVQPVYVSNPIEVPQASASCKELEPPWYQRRYKKSELISTTLQDPDKYSTKCFLFSRETIKKLKLLRPEFSTFQLLTAHIWHKVTAARNLDDNESTTLHFAINCRKRISRLPPAYGGIAALIIAASMTVGKVAANGASVLKEAIENFGKKEALALCKLVEAYALKKESAISNKVSWRTDLLVASSFHFPVYEEFGFGKPVGMTILPTPNDGRLYYFPGREAGSIATFLTLQAEVMQRLQHDPGFLEPSYEA